MKYLVAFTLLLATTISFAQRKYTQYVNPFIGTGGHGHTYPGATMPFGGVQLGPDTRLEGWDGCSGYHYSDSAIYGFSHTHLSGTGVADYCDVLLMPFVGNVEWDKEKYKSTFQKKNEFAQPGFYQVRLDKYGILAEMTATERTGVHRYTFLPGQKNVGILLDLEHRDEVLETSFKQTSPTTIVGMRRSRSWAENQVVYFSAEFSRPIKNIETEKDSLMHPDRKFALHFQMGTEKKLIVRVGISAVSEANATLNRIKETEGKSFATIRSLTNNKWEKQLAKIEVESNDKNDLTVFYTALYHTMLSPNIFHDVDGSFRGTDGKIHQDKSYNNYTVFSLWDTYRSLHPLMNIIDQKRSLDYIKTFLNQFKYGGMLPVWELAGNETFCMIGYHSAPVILDAFKKGIKGFDADYALKAMMGYAESDRFGLKFYNQKAFIAKADEHEGVSKTIEYAFDDWCIAEMAKELGKADVAEKYYKRSLSYRNVFDSETKHSRGRVGLLWQNNFKPSEINNYFTEGNAWHYSFSAPQDMDGFIQLFGGRDSMLKMLNNLFGTTEKATGREQVDVTGLIGQYAHGNEPSHHIVYLFNYLQRPALSQKYIHFINNNFYKNAPDGLIGNEDCGQMSAWYVLSALGFYQVVPGSNQFEIGTPFFPKATIHLENGKKIVISASNLTKENYFVQSVRLNHQPNTNKSFFSYDDIRNGATIQFEMDKTKSDDWGRGPGNYPTTKVEDSNFVEVPAFTNATNKFYDSLEIGLETQQPDAKIFYSTNGGQDFNLYARPFSVEESTTVHLYAERNKAKSPVLTQGFIRLPNDRKLTIETPINTMYKADSTQTLIDGVLGNEHWRSGDWISYYGKDASILVDLRTVRSIKKVGVHVLQDVGPWILYPREVEFMQSSDGINFSPLLLVKNKVANSDYAPQQQILGGNCQRFCKVCEGHH